MIIKKLLKSRERVKIMSELVKINQIMVQQKRKRKMLITKDHFYYNLKP